MILIDTNVVIDVLRTNVLFAQRSARALQSAAQKCIGPIVYSELAPGFESAEDLDSILAELGIGYLPVERQALFLAGQAYKAYRFRGGPRERMLSDFLVGAQASTVGSPLLTRDPARYRTAFPQLELVEP